MKTIAKEFNIKLQAAVIMKKSEGKRTIKYKVQNKIPQRVEKEIESKNSKRRHVGKKGIHSNMWQWPGKRHYKN